MQTDPDDHCIRDTRPQDKLAPPAIERISRDLLRAVEAAAEIDQSNKPPVPIRKEEAVGHTRFCRSCNCYPGDQQFEVLPCVHVVMDYSVC
jgi:hypothetical protein